MIGHEQLSLNNFYDKTPRTDRTVSNISLTESFDWLHQNSFVGKRFSNLKWDNIHLRI